MPVPLPVPAPPPEPDPCDKVGGPGGASIAPRSASCPTANGLAGIFSCATGGGGSFFGTCSSSFGGFCTGTVILSLPGISALRGGSFIWLPPPPPPPPGPGSDSQMMFVFGVSGSTAATLYGLTGRRLAQMSSPANSTSNVSDAASDTVRRLGSWSKRNGTSAGWAPSTWTDRCPAEALGCTSGDWGTD